MFAKFQSESPGSARRPARRLRAWRLAFYRHRRLTSVPNHLHRDIIGDNRRQ